MATLIFKGVHRTKITMGILLTIILHILSHVTVIQSTSDSSAPTDSNFLQIPALGRSANLGYLYDARTETFQDVYVFKAPINSQNFIIETHTPSTLTKMNFANTIAEKNNLFDIRASVSASVLLGLITVQGSASYLNEEKHSARHAESVMMIKSRTISQNLQIYYDLLRPCYNLDLINKTKATHIVTGAVWGANVAISLRDTHQSSSSKENVEGHLSLGYNYLQGIVSVQGSGGVDIEALTNNSNTQFSVKIYGDINIPNEFPQTYTEVYNIVRRIPEFIKKSNRGNGVQLEYTLTPISHLREHLKYDFAQNTFFKELDESFLGDFVKLFDEISLTEQHLNDIYDDFTMYTVCIPSARRSEISNLRNNFLKAKIGFMSAAKSKLISIRAGVDPPTDLVPIIDSYMRDLYNSQNVERRLDEFKGPLEKIELYKILTSPTYSNIMYIGHRRNLKAEIFKKQNGNRNIYVLLMKPKTSNADDLNLQESMSLFLHDLNQPANQLFVVDCDFGQAECTGLTRSTILQYFNGKVIIRDVQAAIVNSTNSRTRQGTQSNAGGNLEPLKLKAVGRFAQIGALYDARTDSFAGHSILQDGYSVSSLIKTNEKDDADAFVVESESVLGKFKSFEIGANQQLSILAEQSPLVRSGQYLKQPPKSGRIEFNGGQSVIYTQFLNEEQIITGSQDFSQSLDLDSIRKFTATHFVSKILFGYNTVLSLEPLTDTESNLTLTEQRSKLENSLKNLRNIFAYKVMSHVDYETQLGEEDLETLDISSFKIYIFSDIQNYESGPELFEGDREHLLDYFNYKFFPIQAETPMGKPIAYELTPLKYLEKFGVIDHNTEFSLINGESQENSKLINSYAILSETLKKTEYKINLLNTELQNNPLVATDSDFTMLKQVSSNFNREFGNFTMELRNVLVQVKSNKVELQALNDLFTKYEAQVTKYFNENGQYIEFEQMILLKEKLELSQKLIGVTYLGRDSKTVSFNQVFSYSNNDSILTYAMVYKPIWMREMTSLWQSTSQSFFENCKDNISGEKNQLVIIDCDFDHPPCKNVSEPTIFQYADGQFVPNGTLTTANNEPGYAAMEIYDNFLRRIESAEIKYEILENQLKKS